MQVLTITMKATVFWISAAFLLFVGIISSPLVAANPQIQATPVAPVEAPRVEDPSRETTLGPELVEAPEVVDATPEPEIDRGIAPMAVVSDGMIMSCNPNPDSIAPNDSVVVGCLVSFEKTKHDTVKISRPSLAASPGYMAEIRVFSAKGGQYYSVLPGHHVAADLYATRYDNAPSIYIEITIYSGAIAGQFDHTFEACLLNPGNQCVGGTDGAVRITLNQTPAGITLQEGTHYRVVCEPTQLDPVDLNQTNSASCRVEGLSALGAKTMRVDHIAWSLTNANGWQVSMAGNGLRGTSGTWVPSTLPTVSSSSPYVFALKFTPVACTASNAPVQLELRTKVTPVGQTTGSSTSSPKMVTIRFSPSFSAEARVTSPEIVEVPYSMSEDQNGTASVTVTYTVSGCRNWTGSTQVGAFQYASDSQSALAPRLTDASHSSATVSGNGNTTISTTEGGTSNGHVSTPVISGTAPGQQVVVTHTINLVYLVPANTPAGTYEATITVSTTAAP